MWIAIGQGKSGGAEQGGEVEQNGGAEQEGETANTVDALQSGGVASPVAPLADNLSNDALAEIIGDAVSPAGANAELVAVG